MIEYIEIRCERDDVPKNGNYHVIESDGTQYWVVNGKQHRDNDLPALTFISGTKAWYQHGHLHRINNHAIIRVDNYNEYWYKNKQYYKQEYFDLMLDKGLITEKEYFIKIL